MTYNINQASFQIPKEKPLNTRYKFTPISLINVGTRAQGPI